MFLRLPYSISIRWAFEYCTKEGWTLGIWGLPASSSSTSTWVSSSHKASAEVQVMPAGWEESKEWIGRIPSSASWSKSKPCSIYKISPSSWLLTFPPINSFASPVSGSLKEMQVSTECFKLVEKTLISASEEIWYTLPPTYRRSESRSTIFSWTFKVVVAYKLLASSKVRKLIPQSFCSVTPNPSTQFASISSPFKSNLDIALLAFELISYKWEIYISSLSKANPTPPLISSVNNSWLHSLRSRTWSWVEVPPA